MNVGTGEADVAQQSPQMWRNYAALLRQPVFTAYVLGSGFTVGGWMALASGTSFLMQDTLGRSATEFGIYVLFLSVGYFLGNFVVSRIRGHAQLERVARFGTILQAASAGTALVAAVQPARAATAVASVWLAPATSVSEKA